MKEYRDKRHVGEVDFEPHYVLRKDSKYEFPWFLYLHTRLAGWRLISRHQTHEEAVDAMDHDILLNKVGASMDTDWVPYFDRLIERAEERGDKFLNALPTNVARQLVEQMKTSIEAAREEGRKAAIEEICGYAKDDILLVPWPKTRPFGARVTGADCKDVWEAFVEPEQEEGFVQSSEMKSLMAILRSVNKGMIDAEEIKVGVG